MMIVTHRFLSICLLSTIALTDVSHQEDIFMDLTHVHRTTHENFIGFAIDTENLRHGRWRGFREATTSVRFQTLGSALAPSFVRVGGTSSDFLTFEDDSVNRRIPVNGSLSSWRRSHAETQRLIQREKRGAYSDIKDTLDLDFYLADFEAKHTNFTMTSSTFDTLHKFIEKVGWNMTFDLNVFKRSGESWDPSNAVKLMDYIVKKGYKIAGWELGNEPNSFYHLIKWRLEPEQLAKDYMQLKYVLRTYKQFDNCIILGPSVTQLDKRRVDQYFKRFMNSGGGDVVTAATFHQYYMGNDSATEKDFLDPAYLNILIPEVATGLNLTLASGSKAKLWIGETSSAIGRLKEASSATYKAAFMWLDKLGVAASGGVDVVIRQSFYGGFNSIIDRDTLEPVPDYWLTLLHKLLVGNRVLSILSPQNTGKLRSYAHCTATNRSGYHRGSVVVYTMNLYDTDKTVTFPDFRSEEVLHVYSLEPQQGRLDSRTVLLNGHPLKMVDDTTLPDLLQPNKTTAPITVKAFTYMFIVFPDVSVKACL